MRVIEPIYLFYLILIFIFSMFIHELGHAICAVRLRAKKVTLYFGTGRLLFDYLLWSIHLRVYVFFFFGARISYEATTQYSRQKHIMISLAGPLANFFLAIICYYLYVYFVHPIFLIALYFNIWLFLSNLIPFKIGKMSSDGWSILCYLLNKKAH